MQILDYLGVDYKGVNVLTSDELRQGIKEYSNWPTIPQLYVKGEFVGGCDIIREMFQAGELQSFLDEKGISASKAPPDPRSTRAVLSARPTASRLNAPASGAFSFRMSAKQRRWTSKPRRRDDRLRLPIPRWEFIALAAALMALNALAIDIMLPGLQQIGASLGVENENHRQYVITAYISGFGLRAAGLRPACRTVSAGAGPCSFGLAIYVAAALTAAIAPSFGVLLALRFIQGIGAASTRVIAVSMIRDVFGGRAHGRDHVAGLHGVHGHPGDRARRRPAGHAVFRVAHDLRVHGRRSRWRSPSGPRSGCRRRCIRNIAGRSPLSSVMGGFAHRAHQPRLALLHACDHHRVRRAVRLHQLGAADLCRPLRARRLVPDRCLPASPG